MALVEETIDTDFNNPALINVGDTVAGMLDTAVSDLFDVAGINLSAGTLYSVRLTSDQADRSFSMIFCDSASLSSAGITNDFLVFQTDDGGATIAGGNIGAMGSWVTDGSYQIGSDADGDYVSFQVPADGLYVAYLQTGTPPAGSSSDVKYAFTIDTSVPPVPVLPPAVPTEFDDLLTGTALDDTIDLLAGNDIYTGLDGNDSIFGGGGDDDISGGAGDDIMRGGTGTDEIYGGEDNDKLSGERGNDYIEGGTGKDKIWAGAGSDFADGGAGRDRVNGNSGNDTLLGGGGNDVVNGGSGIDFIDGGAGNDRLKGGSGADIFVFNATSDDIEFEFEGQTYFVEAGGTGDADTILDFNVNEDTIFLFGTTLWSADSATAPTMITYAGGTIDLQDIATYSGPTDLSQLATAVELGDPLIV